MVIRGVKLVAASFLLWSIHAVADEGASTPSKTEGQAAPSASAGQGTTPPFDLSDAARIEAGKGRFGANCAAYCHGFEGSGGKTPAFRGRTDLKPEEVFKVITEGRRGADVMPAWGNGFSAEKRWELVAYIMYLSRQPAKP